MQTLKTAIVVVLLLTVTYAAYVALTAPPAELPPELVTIIEENGEGGFKLEDIDIGISEGTGPDSLPPPMFNSDMASMTPEPSFPAPLPPSSTVPGASDYSPGTRQSSDSSVGARLSDSPSVADSGSSRGSLNMGYEIPPNTNPPVTASMGSTTASADAPADLNAGPGSFELPAEFGAAPNVGDTVGATNADGSRSNSFAMPNSNDGSQDTPPSFSLTDDEVGNASESTASAANRTALANAIATADRQQQQGQLREALTTLSLFYNTPLASPEDRQAMLGRLDFLAGEVIYSTRHLLEQPYRVSNGETLETIADTLEVPWQLLAGINQVTDPARVFPGQELKVVRGPFRAEVNMGRSEVSLMLGELYAGRFSIKLGKDPAPVPGEYTVMDKQNARTYYALGGANIPAGDPRNPYGDVWLDLGNRMCIHGSAIGAANHEMGCICLTPSDARDVFSILSKGSSVLIVR